MKLWLLKGMIWSLGLLSLGMARQLGIVIGTLTYRMNTRMVRVARTNIRLCIPDMDEAACEKLVRQCLRETGMTFAEMGITWSWPLSKAEKLITEVHNEHLYDDALQTGNGMLILLLHHGNWEIMNHYLYRKNAIFAAIYKPPKDKSLDRWITENREQSGLSLYPAGRAGAEALTTTVREGGIVVYVPDQQPGGKSGVFAPLFNVEAFTGTFTHSLLQQNPDSAALCTYVLRNDTGFKVIFQEADKALYHADPALSAAALNRSIEPCILHNTEQYQWGYKRFKARPQGAAKLY